MRHKLWNATSGREKFCAGNNRARMQEVAGKSWVLIAADPGRIKSASCCTCALRVLANPRFWGAGANVSAKIEVQLEFQALEFSRTEP
jgi:hypothetical protein